MTTMNGLIEAFAVPADPQLQVPNLSAGQWASLANFLSPVSLGESQIVFQRGREESSLYFLESGKIAIHYENAQGQLRMGLVGPGAVFGEASFLGNMLRQATAQSMAPGKAWVLTVLKFREMLTRDSELALKTIQIAASTLARRSRDARKRRSIA
ncbi:cyclic nucleotide-binding domain-containing protein [Lampropedia aestuarii]|uniref:Cyclic nucleotide-binding domain-containing protein n=1 Tax=Lampropedia aestuarii TaxID=2562762 RepID=A0A4S5BYS9_9BURK|nr:cyclic nucleotide-binding domain-containing protein [Lampropedia aestuarii]MDH5857479.1 cyclic nucleotide-binding domain-containing protein [Lampropedia aestuarii]THJ35258.1 cyclic nucleotide-binding domain-containing protein [Lampropedia aestuarii]